MLAQDVFIYLRFVEIFWIGSIGWYLLHQVVFILDKSSCFLFGYLKIRTNSCISMRMTQYIKWHPVRMLATAVLSCFYYVLVLFFLGLHFSKNPTVLGNGFYGSIIKLIHGQYVTSNYILICRVYRNQKMKKKMKKRGNPIPAKYWM